MRFVVLFLALVCGYAEGAAQVAPLPPGMQDAKGRAVLPPPPTGFKLEPLNAKPLSPEVVELIKLEEQFATDVEKGGGAAFARWFTEDGVTLSNGQPPVIGREAIARVATWKPDRYKLTWFVEGAGMSDAKDAAYTWGHYDSETAAAAPGAAPVMHGGRYITFWKRIDGHWRVSLEASAEEPAGGVVLPAGPSDVTPGAPPQVK